MKKTSGILLINKPINMSSFYAVKKVRSLLGIKKVGHAGTLDPLAQGLLIIAFGKYTKLCEYLSGQDKVYETIIKLGETTTTDDAEGEIIAQKDCSFVTIDKIKSSIEKFVGTIPQVPPNFSAIKVNGKRAYAMARNNEHIELQARNITIHSIKLVYFDLPYVKVQVHCSKGSYIRSLARDLGNELTCGAYAYNINRLSSGSFKIEEATMFDHLTKDNIFSYVLSDTYLKNKFFTISLTQEQYENNKNQLFTDLNQFCLIEVDKKITAFAKKSLENIKIVNLLND